MKRIFCSYSKKINLTKSKRVFVGVCVYWLFFFLLFIVSELKFFTSFPPWLPLYLLSLPCNSMLRYEFSDTMNAFVQYFLIISLELRFLSVILSAILNNLAGGKKYLIISFWIGKRSARKRSVEGRCFCLPGTDCVQTVWSTFSERGWWKWLIPTLDWTRIV